MLRIQWRKSGSDAVTASCIASNVALLTLLPYSDASSGDGQLRRRFTVLASPFTPFIAAAHVVATVGHAAISASYAALRVAGSGWVAMPRTAAMGRLLLVPSGMCTSAVSCEVTTCCSCCHADDPLATSSAYRPSSASLI